MPPERRRERIDAWQVLIEGLDDWLSSSGYDMSRREIRTVPHVGGAYTRTGSDLSWIHPAGSMLFFGTSCGTAVATDRR